MFEAAAKIVAYMGKVLDHTWYRKGLKKAKSKGKNPYYVLYH